MKVQGFLAGATGAGIKYEGRLDIGIIYSLTPCVTAGVFTRNRVKAAPVIHGMRRLANGPPLRALVVNSGNANACTGPQGYRDVERITVTLAKALGIEDREVIMSSTGVIGQPLPVKRMERAISSLAEELREDGLSDVADCILTTDTVRKEAMMPLEIGSTPITLYGMAKGAGMIGPDMGPPSATMLAFVLTDAAVDPELWQKALNEAVDLSFNNIIVDGDTSTNDTVLAFANGTAGNRPVSKGEEAEILQAGLTGLLQDLAKKIVQDGEGATKCVTIQVEEAKSREDARQVARTIAQSPLVKTAFFGEDPNWGRILAAAGRAGCPVDPERLELLIDDVPVAQKGMGTGPELEARAKAAMEKDEFQVILRLGLGKGQATVLTCDLSTEYVHINADYRT